MRLSSDERWNLVLENRRAELVRLASLLEADGARVAFVHGIGGIGKSTLIRAFERCHPERRFMWLDPLTLPSKLDAVARAVGEGILVLEDLDRTPGASERIRLHLLPYLAPAARLVLCSRRPPALRWFASLGPIGLVSIALEGLDARDASSLLDRYDVGVSARARVVELCHGHPLMLTLAAQLPGIDGFLDEGVLAAPELVTAMLEWVGARTDDPELVDALMVCVIARRTTERLLQDVLGVRRVRGLFERVRAQSWCLTDRDGLYPHDIVRDVLRADAKWRDRERYDRCFRRVARCCLASLRRRGAQHAADIIFLMGDLPVFHRIASHHEGVRPGPLVQAETFEEVEPLLRDQMGAAWVASARAWYASGNLTLLTMGGEDGCPTEVFARLDSGFVLDGGSTDDADAGDDPCIATVRRLFSDMKLRPGARVLFSPGVVSASGFTSALGNTRLFATAVQILLTDSGIQAMGSVMQPVEFWQSVFTRISDICSFEVVEAYGRRLLVQVQDLRPSDVAGWLERQLFPTSVRGDPRVEVLDRDEFELAVREALKLLPEPAVLERCRLARTPLVLRQRDEQDRPGAGLTRLLVSAIEALSVPRQRDVVRATYVSPPVKQLAVASELGLSFATYRRALASGVRELTETLWSQEVEGPADVPPITVDSSFTTGC